MSYLTNVFAGGEVFIEFIRYSPLIVVRDHIIFISIIIREQGRNITSLLHYCSKNWIMYYNCWCVIVRYQKTTMLDARCYLIIYIKWDENQCLFNWPYYEKLFNDGNQVHHHVNVSLLPNLLPMKSFPI